MIFAYFFVIPPTFMYSLFFILYFVCHFAVNDITLAGSRLMRSRKILKQFQATTVYGFQAYTDGGVNAIGLLKSTFRRIETVIIMMMNSQHCSRTFFATQAYSLEKVTTNIRFA